MKITYCPQGVVKEKIRMPNGKIIWRKVPFYTGRTAEYSYGSVVIDGKVKTVRRKVLSDDGIIRVHTDTWELLYINA